MIREYKDHNGVTMAIVIPKDHQANGIEFFTKDEDYMQIACMGHPSGHIISPHYHNKFSRTVDYTCESLIIRKGVVKVTLYDDMQPVHVFEVNEGDIITMYSGGHGFEIIEDVDMVEIKQGPYLGVNDKTRF